MRIWALFGYEIVNVLVTDIVPDAKVKSAMNDINAAQREQVAAQRAGRGGENSCGQESRGGSESKALQGKGSPIKERPSSKVCRSR